MRLIKVEIRSASFEHKNGFVRVKSPSLWDKDSEPFPVINNVPLNKGDKAWALVDVKDLSKTVILGRSVDNSYNKELNGYDVIWESKGKNKIVAGVKDGNLKIKTSDLEITIENGKLFCDASQIIFNGGLLGGFCKSQELKIQLGLMSARLQAVVALVSALPGGGAIGGMPIEDFSDIINDKIKH